MRKATVTPEIMTKTWKLHNRGVDERLIAEILGISFRSAIRIITIMTAAQNGEDVDSIEGNNHQKQKDFAKRFFGIEDKADETVEEKTDADMLKRIDENNVATFVLKVSVLLEKQNELLEALLHSLDVDLQTHCKGVERR